MLLLLPVLGTLLALFSHIVRARSYLLHKKLVRFDFDFAQFI